MSKVVTLQTTRQAEWLAVLNRTHLYDFYHLPCYHALAEQGGEGDACLFVYEEGEYVIALPLLLRPVASVPGLEEAGGSWKDATSVYGYAGPVASHGDVPGAVSRRFQTALQAELRERGVVSLFSRLHPLIPQDRLVSNLGERNTIGETVSIDLTLPLVAQRAAYRADHKLTLNKLRRLGVSCTYVPCRDYLGEFINIYNETMHRVGASDSYFYDMAYFEDLIACLESNIHLFICSLEGQVICGGLFVVCNDIVQYHLSGTLSNFLPLAPMKLLVDTVRTWATEQGLKVLHLGGGVGAQRDSLFLFKAGFSQRRHDFRTWRWTPTPDVYARLHAEKRAWNRSRGVQAISPHYFPQYRCPTAPIEN